MARPQTSQTSESVLGWEEETEDEEGEEIMCKVQTHVSVPGPVWAKIVIACGAPDNSPECVVDYVEMMNRAVDAMSGMIFEAKEREIAARSED